MSRATTRAAGGGLRLDINTASPNLAGYKPAAVIPLRTATRLQHRGQQHGCPQHRLDRVSQPAAEHRAARHKGLPAQHRRLARKPVAVSELDAGLRQFHRGRRWCLSSQSAGIESAPGARDPEAGKKKLFFANPWGIAFTTPSGVRYRLRDLAGSDLLVKLNVDGLGNLSFTGEDRTTATSTSTTFLDPATSGGNAGRTHAGS